MKIYRIPMASNLDGIYDEYIRAESESEAAFLAKEKNPLSIIIGRILVTNL